MKFFEGGVRVVTAVSASTQTSNISCFWESQMDLDLIEAVDPKQALPGCYLEAACM